MDFPKLTFAPAGNTTKGWSSNDLIDLNDIFDDDFFPSDLDFTNLFQPDNPMWGGNEVHLQHPKNQESYDTISKPIQGQDVYGQGQAQGHGYGHASQMNSSPFATERQRTSVPPPPFIAHSYPPPTPYSVDIDNLMTLGPNNPSRILYANESAASSSTYATTAYAPPSYASPIYAPPTYSPSTYAPTYAAEEANNATVNASKTSKFGVITIPPMMPRAASAGGKIKDEPLSPGSSNDRKYDPEGDDNDLNNKKRKKIKGLDPKDMTDEQRLERRERNREHAKKSRIRKRVLLDLLQDQLSGLRGENVKLRRVVIERLPLVASKVFEQCTAEVSMLLIDDDYNEDNDDIHEGRPRTKHLHLKHADEITATKMIAGAHLAAPKQMARILMEPDFRLIEALIHSQQNFVLSDPSLPDNPIVYCSDGFCNLTGYKRQFILGRNCRFLQGPGTDQAAVDIIRKGVLEGCDISVCLLNYKADGSPFWNQFFVAALRDSEGGVVNYVGVQCEVNTLPIEGIKDRVKRLPVPIL